MIRISLLIAVLFACCVQPSFATLTYGGSATGLVLVTQDDPTTNGQHELAVDATIHDPAITQMGWGFLMNEQSFAATPGMEADNTMGYYYNLNGPGGPTINQYEHSFNDVWETAFRASAGTDTTLIEHNLNFHPPDNSTTVTNVAGGWAPLAGDTLVFDTGTPQPTGTVLLDFSGGVLTWRQDFGIPVALDGMTVSSGGTANLGATVTEVTTGNFRPYAFLWDTLVNEGSFGFASKTGLAFNNLDVVNNAVGINWLGTPNGPPNGSSLTVGGLSTNVGVATISVQTAGTVGTTPSPDNPVSLDIAMDLTGTDYNFNKPVGIRILSPSARGSGSSVGSSVGLWIFDQGGHGSNGSTIRIAAQTCDFSFCTGERTGNVLQVGGNWNNGHYTFESNETTGDHLWRDQTNEVFRVSTDAVPGSEIGGDAIVTGSGAATHGPAIWAISDGASFDTGTKVCTALGVGMTCQNVNSFGTNASPVLAVLVGCATTHASGVSFIAMCK